MAAGPTAIVPGHVTLFFTVHRTDDPATTGSTGVGLTLEEGVRVEVAPGSGQTVNGSPASIAAVDGVLAALDVTAAVDIETALPLGAGFGVSGAAALGTALGVDRLHELDRSRSELVRTAHVAEVEAGTGLGDVVAQAHGGVVMRLDPGAPPRSRLQALEASGPLEVLTRGELDTAAVIAGDTTAITRAGETALTDLRTEPTLPRAFALGRRFARETALLDPEVERIIEAVERHGGSAAMGMLGRTVVALDDGLTRAGYEDGSAVRIADRGAHLVEVA